MLHKIKKKYKKREKRKKQRKKEVWYAAKMADSLQLDVAVLKLTNNSEVNTSEIDANSHELVNGQLNKFYCDKIERSETQQSEIIRTENNIASNISILPSQSSTVSPSPSSSATQSSLSSINSNPLSSQSSLLPFLAMSPSLQNVTTAATTTNAPNSQFASNDLSALSKSVLNFDLNSKVASYQSQAKNLEFQKPQAMDATASAAAAAVAAATQQQEDDLRKKRCADRYDSSESSDR